MNRRDFLRAIPAFLLALMFGPQKEANTMQLHELMDKVARGRTLDPLERQQLIEKMRGMEDVINLAKSWVIPGTNNPIFVPPVSIIVDKVMEQDAAELAVRIPSDYKHLLIMAAVRTTDASTGDFMYGQFNGDTGSNYQFQRLSGSDATASAGYSGSANSFHVGSVAESGAAAGECGFFVLFIPHYTSAVFYKSVITLEGIFTTPTGKGAAIFANQWLNVAPLESIRFYLSAGNIAAGSLISIYGIL